MTTLDGLKAELERFGADNDAINTERPRRMLNITRDTGEFLSVQRRVSCRQSARFVMDQPIRPAT